MFRALRHGGAGERPAALHLRQSRHHAFPVQPGLVGRTEPRPGIIAVKSPAPEPQAVAEHLAELRGIVPDGFSLGYSGDWNSVEAPHRGRRRLVQRYRRPVPRSRWRIVLAVQFGMFVGTALNEA